MPYVQNFFGINLRTSTKVIACIDFALAVASIVISVYQMVSLAKNNDYLNALYGSSGNARDTFREMRDSQETSLKVTSSSNINTFCIIFSSLVWYKFKQFSFYSKHRTSACGHRIVWLVVPWRRAGSIDFFRNCNICCNNNSWYNFMFSLQNKTNLIFPWIIFGGIRIVIFILAVLFKVLGFLIQGGLTSVIALAFIVLGMWSSWGNLIIN